jgi:hypothetical protein
MVCSRKMVVVYLQEQDVESFCLSIYTENGENCCFVKWSHSGKAQSESYAIRSNFGAGHSLRSTPTQ